jgi:serine/threonine protein kinase
MQMTLTPGIKLGPYEILAPIGSGGMGEVWKARDTRLDRIVAIKKVKEQHSERFKQDRSSEPPIYLPAFRHRSRLSRLGIRRWQASIKPLA